MSGSAVRSSCAAGSVLILLLSHLRAGEGLKCYESSCLKDHTMKTLHCPEEEVSQMTLNDCTLNYFRQTWQDVPVPDNMKTGDMKCIKLQGRGQLPKGHVGLDVIRMCSPQIQDMCEVLSDMVATKIKHSDVQDLKLQFVCQTCNNTDGCNSAPIHTIPSLVVLVVVCFTALVTNG